MPVPPEKETSVTEPLLEALQLEEKDLGRIAALE